MSFPRDDGCPEVDARPVKRPRLSSIHQDKSPPSSDWRQVYKPLDASRREIRVLRLLPSRHLKKNPRGMLDTISLHDAKFAALSYVWGDQSKQKYMILNGYRVLIGLSAHTALRHIRWPCKESYIWIDALCINQEDLEERSQQVSLMGETFSKAEPVWLWAGRYTKDAANFRQTVRSLVKVVRSGSIGDINSEYNRIMNEISPDRWRSIEKFLDNPFWHRVWILQEIVLSAARGQAMLRFGGWYLHYDDFMEGVLALNQAAMEQMWKHQNVTVALQCEIFQHQFNFRAAFVKRTARITAALNLTETLMASNPRDQVYGLLGLFPNLQIKADYTKAVVEVYEEATMEVFRTTESLNFLLQCQIPEENTVDGDPSWVLDWGANRARLSGLYAVLVAGIYDACGSRKPIVSHRKKNELNVQGCKLFQIECLRALQYDISSAYNFFEELVRVRKWMRNLYELRRVPNGEDFEKAFQRTLMLDALVTDDNKTVRLDSANQRSSHQKALHRVQDIFRAIDNIEAAVTMTADANSNLSQLYEDNGSRLHHISFSVGPLGELCLFSDRANEGDWICILGGCSVPVVLRPFDGKREDGFRFVGSAYVHGMMDGEGLSQMVERQSTSDVDAKMFEDIVLM